MNVESKPPSIELPQAAERGGARFWRVNAAMFIGGFSTFALLYCVQPMLPAFVSNFGVTPAAASLAISAPTIVIAVAIFAAGAISDAVGRKRVMALSLAAASVTVLLSTLSATWPQFVALRALTGLALSGVPSVAMAYLAEEMDRSALGLAMGLYIAGSTLGGMAGRLSVAAISQASGWRFGMATIGAISLLGAGVFALALPRERRLPRRRPGFAALASVTASHFGDAGLRYLFALGFLVMGAFVCTYNYIGFRLMGPPFSLSQAQIGLVYAIYLVGAVTSPVVGDLAGRFGRRRVIGPAIVAMPFGVAATLFDNLPMTILGVGLVTVGFFGSHSIASSWVGLRASGARAQASALYLFFYYVGSSVAGWAGGWLLARWGWPGVAAFLGALSGIALIIAHRLSSVPPPAHLAAPG